jgi:hypothetical protein
VLDLPGAGRLLVGDLDGDGDADAVVEATAPASGALGHVYRNAAGLLEPAPGPGLPGPVLALADLDGDGALDVVGVGRVMPFWLVWLKGRGDATFEPPAALGAGTSLPERVEAGDVDGNGWTDLVSVGPGNSVGIIRNLGGGAFSTSTMQAGTGAWNDLALGDLDGDGDLDVALVSWTGGQVMVLLGAGDGTFVAGPPLRYAGPKNVAIGALAGRARHAVLVRGSLTEEVGVLEVGPGGALSLAGRWTLGGGPFGSPVPLAVADVDGDLRPDVVSGGDQVVAVRRAACLP